MQLDPVTVSIIAFVGVTGVIGAVFMLLREMSSNNVEERLDILAGKKSAKGEGEFTLEALIEGVWPASRRR